MQVINAYALVCTFFFSWRVRSLHVRQHIPVLFYKLSFSSVWWKAKVMKSSVDWRLIELILIMPGIYIEQNDLYSLSCWNLTTFPPALTTLCSYLHLGSLLSQFSVTLESLVAAQLVFSWVYLFMTPLLHQLKELQTLPFWLTFFPVYSFLLHPEGKDTSSPTAWVPSFTGALDHTVGFITEVAKPLHDA